MVVISSETVARDLLDKRSAIYSDRPVIRTSEMYALLIVIHPVLDVLPGQSWIRLQHCAPSVW
jgi:hypothetical protein